MQQIAVDLMHAGPLEIGLLGALGQIPYALLACVAGYYADRWDRRTVIIACHLLRGGLWLAAGGALLLRLDYRLLAGAVLLAAVCTVQHDITVSAFVPDLAPLKRLVHSNSLLELAGAAATLAALLSAGFIMGPGRSLFALAGCGGLYLLAALLLRRLRPPAPLERGPLDQTLGQSIRAALRSLVADRRLLGVVVLTFYNSFWLAAVAALLFVRLRRELELPDAVIGYVYGCAPVGAMAGSLLAPAFGTRLSVRGIVVLAGFVTGLSCCALGLPVAPPLRLAVVVAAQAALAIAATLYNVNVISYRQRLVPRAEQGRVVGAIRLLTWGAVPLAPLLGGFLMQHANAGFVFELAGASLAAMALLVGVIPAFGFSERGAPAAAPAAGSAP